MGERRCYFCRKNGSADPLERHHVFGGNHADRKKSEKVKIMQEQGWTEAEFIRAFGKSYL